jgi:hypothetical protein
MSCTLHVSHIRFHVWLPRFKHIPSTNRLVMFIYIFLLTCETMFLQDSCNHICFHIFTVILLTDGLLGSYTVSISSIPHFGDTCCLHIQCDETSGETYLTRGKKVEAHIHACIYIECFDPCLSDKDQPNTSPALRHTPRVGEV